MTAPDAAQRAWDAASPEQREVWRERATRRIADRKAHPLAYAKLWHSANTSQSYALANLAKDATLVTGGNGAGKTMLGGMVAVAVLLGRNHPDVQRWFALNPSIDQSFFPPDGGPVIASSLNSAMSVDIQRAMVAMFVPPGEVHWRNEAAPGVSSVQVRATKHKMVFLTNDAGWKKFQGYRGALVWLDEEHDEAVYNECLQRISRVKWEGRSGWVLKTMTPLQGLTWVYRRFVEEPDEGTTRHHLWGEDNPHLDQEKRERILKSYGAHERQSRDKGTFISLEGRVFIEWDRSIHVIPSFTPPADWMRFNGWDFGTRNPTAIHWLAHDPGDDVIHVYREHYKAEKSLKWHAGRYHRMCG
ncbi:MAG: terminase family protein, partial [Dehalococcoidia bacterium]